MEDKQFWDAYQHVALCRRKLQVRPWQRPVLQRICIITAHSFDWFLIRAYKHLDAFWPFNALPPLPTAAA